MSETILTAENLKFRYDSEQPVYALDGVSTSVKRGEFVAVLGANGCGKSTLAKHFNAILLPESGKVYVEGMDTSDDSKLYDIRQTVGMVFQNPDNQIVATVVEEDVAFAPENLGLPSQEIRRRVDEALKAVGMENFKRSAPHMLSGGQKQRVAIAGVLAMEPEVLVLDEPTAGLDPAGRENLMANIRDYHRNKGKTIILVSHSMDEIARNVDRILVLKNAHVLMQGTPAEVFARGEELLSAGLDVPQITRIAMELKRRGVDIDPAVYTVEALERQLLALRKGGAGC